MLGRDTPSPASPEALFPRGRAAQLRGARSLLCLHRFLAIPTPQQFVSLFGLSYCPWGWGGRTQSVEHSQLPLQLRQQRPPQGGRNFRKVLMSTHLQVSEIRHHSMAMRRPRDTCPGLHSCRQNSQPLLIQHLPSLLAKGALVFPAPLARPLLQTLPSHAILFLLHPHSLPLPCSALHL